MYAIRSYYDQKAKVFVVHGEEESSETFAKELNKNLNLNAYVPQWGEIIDLDTMRSEYASYGHTDDKEIESIDKQLKSLKDTLQILNEKYENAKTSNKLKNIQGIEDDIKDAKELINMIIDGL